MKCLLCSKYFNIKRGYSNLFSNEKEFICNKCKKEIQFKIEINEVPLKNHMLKIISGIDYKKYQNNYIYIKEMSAVREKIKELLIDDYDIIYDDFLLEKKTLKNLEYISEITDKDIVVIANTYRV